MNNKLQSCYISQISAQSLCILLAEISLVLCVGTGLIAELDKNGTVKEFLDLLGEAQKNATAGTGSGMVHIWARSLPREGLH
jgi:hypothetical protein